LDGDASAIVLEVGAVGVTRDQARTVVRNPDIKTVDQQGPVFCTKPVVRPPAA
jgi:hypothetical protein